MLRELKVLTNRIDALERLIAELARHLRSAASYASSDPASSLTKSRIILEKVLVELYSAAMRKQPARPMIGIFLADKAFMSQIPRRIASRMDAIRGMSNLGAHGEDVEVSDAIRVLQDLVDVLEWYVVHRNPSSQDVGRSGARQSLEILPQLREKYFRYLRSDITSVQFVQSMDRCFLETTMVESVSEYLADEISKRTDLAFISSGLRDTDKFFDPERPIAENARRFLFDFSVVSIINCTDLFTPEAQALIDSCWRLTGIAQEYV